MVRSTVEQMDGRMGRGQHGKKWDDVVSVRLALFAAVWLKTHKLPWRDRVSLRRVLATTLSTYAVS